MPKPVIAAINGAAAGGGFSLALACDFRAMAKSTFLRQAYTSSGLSIDGEGSFVLPRLVGLGRALEILAFDRPISSEQAMAWGLVTKVVKDEDVIEEATEMARGLASGSPASFGWSKGCSRTPLILLSKLKSNGCAGAFVLALKLPMERRD